MNSLFLRCLTLKVLILLSRSFFFRLAFLSYYFFSFFHVRHVHNHYFSIILSSPIRLVMFVLVYDTFIRSVAYMMKYNLHTLLVLFAFPISPTNTLVPLFLNQPLFFPYKLYCRYVFYRNFLCKVQDFENSTIKFLI